MSGAYTHANVCVSEWRKICICARRCVCVWVIFCNTPSFISGLVWVQVVGFNAVQMGDAERRVARFFQSFGRTRALLIKAEEIFTVPQTKPRILILEGERRASETAMLYFVFIKGGDWQLGGNFPALNQGSYWRGQSREHRDLAKQSNALASCYWLKAWLPFLFSLSYHRLLSLQSIYNWGEDCCSLYLLLLLAPPKPLFSSAGLVHSLTSSVFLFFLFFFLLFSAFFSFWLFVFWLITVSRVLGVFTLGRATRAHCWICTRC